MVKLEEWILGLSNPQGVWIFLAFLLGAIIMKKQPTQLLLQLQERKMRDIAQAKELLECAALSDEAHKLLKDYIETYSFKKFYGIMATSYERKKLMVLAETHEKEITWVMIRRAFQNRYLVIEDDELTVKLNRFDWASSKASSFFGYVVGIFSVLQLLVLSGSSQDYSLIEFIARVIFATSVFLSAFFFKSLTWPYKNALVIKKILESEEVKPSKGTLSETDGNSPSSH
tara:strand:+ start:6202 stop:6888 length:687 start_codon:yes stop_codon:yes gene_type:complete